jgi:hypothetical protein
MDWAPTPATTAGIGLVLLRLQMNGSHFLTSVLLLLFYMTMIMSMG